MNERDRTVNIPEMRERARRAAKSVHEHSGDYAPHLLPDAVADAVSDVWQDELQRLYTRIHVIEDILTVHYAGHLPETLIRQKTEDIEQGRV